MIYWINADETREIILPDYLIYLCVNIKKQNPTMSSDIVFQQCINNIMADSTRPLIIDNRRKTRIDIMSEVKRKIGAGK